MSQAHQAIEGTGDFPVLLLSKLERSHGESFCQSLCGAHARATTDKGGSGMFPSAAGTSSKKPRVLKEKV